MIKPQPELFEKFQICYHQSNKKETVHSNVFLPDRSTAYLKFNDIFKMLTNAGAIRSNLSLTM